MTDERDGKEHPLVGHVIGERYRIDALLGEGGMGAVFRATHLSLDRPVAVKVLHPRLSDDAQIAKRFDREALAISKLDHPNCVQVIDFGTTAKGMKYLVMQFLEGRELRELTGVALPIEQALHLGTQVLRALEHAHKRGLVHRDLKPENIFLVTDDYGEQIVKLVDFGIVKLLEAAGQEKLTRMGMAFGTPTYMSPEQAAGGKVDARTDLYAVGVLLYELLTGVPPFTADEPGILLRMHILADPPPLPDTVPPAVAAVVGKLLGKEPDERYADATEARRALAGAYKLPSKITGVIGVAEPPPNVATDPPSAPGLAITPQAEPTPSEVPELFVRSGGTVLAGGGGAYPTAASSSASYGVVPMASPTGSMSHGAMPAAMPMSGASSMSHGAMPSGPMSAGVPVVGAGHYTSEAHPLTGPYAAVPSSAYGRSSGRRTGTLLVVVLVLITWVAIGALWLAGRDDGRGPPSGAAATPAASGLYRFADSEAAPGTPAADAADSAMAPPPGPPDGKGSKKPKKVKKPKDDEDDD